MTISKADFLSFITELVMRNPILGIPPLQDGLFANLSIFYYLYDTFLFFGEGKGKREGKREGNILIYVYILLPRPLENSLI